MHDPPWKPCPEDRPAIVSSPASRARWLSAANRARVGGAPPAPKPVPRAPHPRAAHGDLSRVAGEIFLRPDCGRGVAAREATYAESEVRRADEAPGGQAGSWYRLALDLPPGCTAAVLRAETAAGQATAPCLGFAPGGAGPAVGARVVFLPPETARLRLRMFGPDATGATAAVRRVRLARPAAAGGLAWRHAALVCGIGVRGLWRDPRGLPARLRALLAALAEEDAAASVRALWPGLAAPCAAAERVRLAAATDGADWPSIAVLVLAAEANSPALAASLAAANAALAFLPPARSPAEPDYLAVLQAGEMVAPHALALLAWEAFRAGRPPILSADEDRLDPDGGRRDPLRKPAPGRLLLLSGTQATGVWLIRRDLLAGTGWRSPTEPLWAETLRLDAWLRLHEAGGTAAARHLPHVLTHRRADAERAPAAALAAVGAAHLARTGFPARLAPGPERTLRLRVSAPRGQRPRVALIVPSTCRGAHVRRCLGAVLAGTDYADIALVLVHAAPDPPTPRQRRLIAGLAADPRVRPLLLDVPRFNFAAVCNRAVAACDAPLICLLNDDVLPRDPGWLAAMVGHLADPTVGVVGARLLYPDGSLQHAGVALRPDGGAVHAGRFRPGAAAGTVLSREVAAVTGACLLTRRTLWDRLGGLDIAYPSACNDIDYCLRVRELGYGVVVAAEAPLTHLESRSFGRHYAPAEAARAAAERERLRRRFPVWFAADPFHPEPALPPAP